MSYYHKNTYRGTIFKNLHYRVIRQNYLNLAINPCLHLKDIVIIDYLICTINNKYCMWGHTRTQLTKPSNLFHSLVVYRLVVVGIIHFYFTPGAIHCPWPIWHVSIQIFIFYIFSLLSYSGWGLSPRQGASVRPCLPLLRRLPSIVGPDPPRTLWSSVS